MADYDSDSSGVDDVETGVTLGYASKEPTGDDFSQLGGHPVSDRYMKDNAHTVLTNVQQWLDSKVPPSGAFAKCKVCNGLLNLLLELNGDLPDKFPGHERRVYLIGCRKKTCRRKEGSVRGIRTTRITKTTAQPKAPVSQSPPPAEESKPKQVNIGESLFGVQASKSPQVANPSSSPGTQAAANPFSAPGQGASNPFASASSLSAKPSQKPDPAEDLPQTFADKARIAAENDPKPKPAAGPVEPWPEASAFPAAYPSYYIDADKEYLEAESAAIPSNVRLDRSDEAEGGAGSSSSATDDKAAFESTMDKTFQRFADRLSQNPEQVLRYDYGGQPLLYSKKDAVGKAWPRVPRCKCGGERVFELQLTPHAITELEAEDLSLEGMDWGTVILAVCSNDCDGNNEEWVGVQWEELAGK